MEELHDSNTTNGLIMFFKFPNFTLFFIIIIILRFIYHILMSLC